MEDFTRLSPCCWDTWGATRELCAHELCMNCQKGWKDTYWKKADAQLHSYKFGQSALCTLTHSLCTPWFVAMSTILYQQEGLQGQQICLNFTFSVLWSHHWNEVVAWIIHVQLKPTWERSVHEHICHFWVLLHWCAHIGTSFMCLICGGFENGSKLVVSIKPVNPGLFMGIHSPIYAFASSCSNPLVFILFLWLPTTSPPSGRPVRNWTYIGTLMFVSEAS